MTIVRFSDYLTIWLVGAGRAAGRKKGRNYLIENRIIVDLITSVRHVLGSMRMSHEYCHPSITTIGPLIYYWSNL